jgi:hypothetical protein
MRSDEIPVKAKLEDAKLILYFLLWIISTEATTKKLQLK